MPKTMTAVGCEGLNRSSSNHPKAVIFIGGCMDAKKCTACKKILLISEFHRSGIRGEAHNPKQIQEYYSRCKKCSSRLRKRKTIHLHKKWRDKYPEKIVSRQVYHAALNSGKIKKSDTCEICGKSSKLDGHHKDYNKPLEVMWMCRQCHTDIHRHRLTK